MKKETVDALCEAMDDIGIEYDRRDDYSGRGMYGETTHGVVVSGLASLLPAIAQAAINLANRDELTDKTAAAFVKDLKRVETDNMGHDTIVY